HDRKIGVQKIGIPESRISTIYNGILDTDARAVPEQSSTVVMVARFAPQKDYATLLRAIDNLSCEVICVGSGTDSEEFRQIARKLAPRSEGRVQFLGVRPDVDHVLAKSGIFVLSSRFEGLPISIIEAMRAGLPIVASDVGGVPELLVERGNGYLFEAGDSDTLTTLLTQL